MSGSLLLGAGLFIGCLWAAWLIDQYYELRERQAETRRRFEIVVGLREPNSGNDGEDRAWRR